MAKDQSPDEMASRTFLITLVGGILFIAVSFIAITFQSYGL
jgi:hypothetical protein